MREDLFDETVWFPPDHLPDLSGEKIIAVDVETKDPHLRDLGPGWVRKDGNLIGISVAASDWSAYLPIAHEGGGNMAKDLVLRWLQDQLNHGMDVVFHNAQYDLGWLLSEGIEVKGRILDTMIAAPLLDENRFSYSLNALGSTYLGQRKAEEDLRRAAAQHGVDAKAEMWKLPAERVALYAEKDATLTLSLWHVLHKKLMEENCGKILDMELSLLPMVFEMKRRGVRVDVDKAQQTKKLLQGKEDALLKQIHDETQIHIEPWNAKSLAGVFENLGLTYERTAKSDAPSFTKHFLKNHEHPIAKKILEIREYNKANTTFVDTILNHQYNGRIHCQFNQLRSDEGGTVSGRFSSSNPNLQQVPSRHPEIKSLIRGLFIPEEGCRWGSFDYSAQEPRWMMHYASLTPATRDNEKVVEIVAQYQKDDLDFHQLVADIAGVGRNLAKTINLGIMYGMGIGKLAQTLGDIPFKEAKTLRNEYDEKVPFIRALASAVMEAASSRSEVRTMLGRKCRFPMRELKGYSKTMKKPISAEKLEERWQDILNTPEESRDDNWQSMNPVKYQVAFVYKALNRLIQASAADQTKQAMSDCMGNGHWPMLTVHDELCFSIESDEQVAEIKDLMENCAPGLTIPSKVDVGLGDNWGSAK
jgi:DNA polymerase I-like protein with 3'-5' exonuclease and polymerase domains|tara:strand:+ start:2972 stop:4900 length:1929 start_codon:yes stop_codon:yes gene_type:complete